MNDHQAEVAGFRVSYFDRATLEILYREIFVRQCYRPPPLGAEPLIFDCGANLGMATLFFKFLCPHCRIKCFEPDPATFSLLDRNILGNSLDRVEPFNVALWNEDCMIDFFSSAADPGSLLMSTNAGRMRAPSIQVEGRRLSGFIDCEVDFLKLDVEGAEHRVLHDLAESGKLQLVRQMAINITTGYPVSAPPCLAF